MAFILIEILSFFGWYNLLTCIYKINSPISERLLGAFLLTVWQITAISILMAWCGGFAWGGVFSLNLIVVGILWVPPGLRDPKALRGNCQAFLRRLNYFWHTPVVTYTALLTGFVVAVVLWYALRLPMMQYDVYHVVRGALMIQEGHLPPFGWDGLGVDYYPGNVDVLFAWRLLGTRNDAWCAPVSLVFAVAGMVAIYRTLRELVGNTKETSAVIAMCLFSMTSVIHLAWMSMVDLAVAAMVWVAWSFAVSRRLSTWKLVLAALAGGWAVGGKTSAVYWIAGMGVFLIWRIWNDNHRGTGT